MAEAVDTVGHNVAATGDVDDVLATTTADLSRGMPQERIDALLDAARSRIQRIENGEIYDILEERFDRFEGGGVSRRTKIQKAALRDITRAKDEIARMTGASRVAHGYTKSLPLTAENLRRLHAQDMDRYSRVTDALGVQKEDANEAPEQCSLFGDGLAGAWDSQDDGRELFIARNAFPLARSYDGATMAVEELTHMIQLVFEHHGHARFTPDGFLLAKQVTHDFLGSLPPPSPRRILLTDFLRVVMMFALALRASNGVFSSDMQADDNLSDHDDTALPPKSAAAHAMYKTREFATPSESEPQSSGTHHAPSTANGDSDQEEGIQTLHIPSTAPQKSHTKTWNLY